MKLLLQLIVAALFCVLYCTTLAAQSNQTLMQSEIQTATTDLQDEQYRSAVRHLDKAKTYLGKDSTTAQIQYLLVKSYLGLEYFDDARREIKRFFDVGRESDFGYTEMLGLLSKIDDLEEYASKQGAVEKNTQMQEDDAWRQAQLANTNEAYRNYISRYPGSPNAIKAREAINRDVQSKLAAEQQLADRYHQKYKSRKALKTWFLIPGLLATSFGALKAMDAFDFDDDYYSYNYYDYNGNYLYTSYGGDYGEEEGVAWMVAGGVVTLAGLAFIHPRKYKKRWKAQEAKIQQLRSEGITFQTVPAPTWSIGTAAKGTGLSFKLTF